MRTHARLADARDSQRPDEGAEQMGETILNQIYLKKDRVRSTVVNTITRQVALITPCPQSHSLRANLPIPSC